jgi:hypothetical protein
MKLLLAIPDGAGIRNFILGSFLRQLQNGEQACILHSIPTHTLPAYKRHLNDTAASVEWKPLLNYHETVLSFVLRYSLSYAHMYWADTYAMRQLRNAPINGSWRTRATHRVSRMIGRVAASKGRIRMLCHWHDAVARRLPEIAQYQKLLQSIGPSVVFCSNQRALATLPLVLASKLLGIPTVSFVFSWDNLTSKGRIAAPFDHYFVWSRHMREELLKYYDDVAADHVHIVGTPQFDPYADKSILWSRNEFCRRINADPGRPLICYSGGDSTTTPEDPKHVAILMGLIRSGAIVGNPQVVLRPAPVDHGSRYDEVRRTYPELVYCPPAWMHTEPLTWLASIPLPEDVQFLANLTQHADLNINMASTMTLDYAIHDKPVINIAFDASSPPPFKVPVWDLYYRYEHYRPVVELGSARFARSPAELAAHVNAYLENPSLDQEGRRRLTALQIGFPLGLSAQHAMDALRAIARRGC